MAEMTVEKVKNRAMPYKWIGLGLIVVALFLAWRVLPMETWLAAFNAWVAGLGAGGMVVYGIFYIAATILFVPGALITLGSGFLFGLGWGTLVVSVSATTGASLAFLIARYVARDAVAKKVNAYPKFQAIDRAIGKHGGKIVGLLRLSPAVPFNLSNYLFGLTSVKFWPYILATWAGTLPGTVMYVYLGVLGKAGLAVAAGAEVASSSQTLMLGLGLVATVAVTLLITRIARRALRDASVEEAN